MTDDAGKWNPAAGRQQEILWTQSYDTEAVHYEDAQWNTCDYAEGDPGPMYGVQEAHGPTIEAIEGNGQAVSSAPAHAPSSAKAEGQPLRVIAMFPCLRRGGAEQWLIYLAKFLNPRRVALLRCIVANPQASD